MYSIYPAQLPSKFQHRSLQTELRQFYQHCQQTSVEFFYYMYIDSHLRFRLCVNDAGQLELYSDVSMDPRLVCLDLGLVWKKKHSTEVLLGA